VDCCLLGSDDMQFHRWLAAFRSNVSPPSSELISVARITVGKKYILVSPHPKPHVECILYVSS
jgi:hypothetical protein